MAGENCTNCAYVQALDKRVNELEVTVRDQGTKLADVDRIAAVSAEQIKAIYKILNEIKSGVEKLDNKVEELKNRQHPDILRIEEELKDQKKKIEEIEKKPGQYWDKVAIGVISAIVIAAIMKFIG